MLTLHQVEIKLCRGRDTLEQEVAQRLIQKNTTNGRVLRTAAKKGYVNVVRFILEAEDHFHLSAKGKEMCSNEGAADVNGNTPLHLAALNGYGDLANLIFFKGQCREVYNRYNETPLYLACREGHDDVVRHLCIRVDECCSIKDNMSPIEVAAFNGHATIVQYLLSFGYSRKNSLTLVVKAGHEDVFAVLLHHIAGTGILEVERNSVHEAAERGRDNMCEMLLDAGLKVSRVNSEGNTPLELAAKYGHFTTVQLLVSHGAVNERRNFMWQDDSVRTAIDFAIENGHVNIAHFLFSNGSVVSKSHLLQAAIRKGRVLAMMSVLALSEGDDLDTYRPSTLIHLACHGKVEMVRYMLQKGISVNAQDKQLNSPLHAACKNGSHESIIKFLILQGGEINATNKEGETPLHVTTDFNLQKVLLENGADPHIPDKRGFTILHKVRNVTIVQMLLECNVLVDARTLKGSTPLMKASYRRKRDIAELLIESGASVNARNKKDNTPVHLAVRRNSAQLVKSLVKFGADVNAVNKSGQTVLHVVKSAKMVRILIDQGANMTVKDMYGQTPLECAEKDDNAEVVSAFQEIEEQNKRV